MQNDVSQKDALGFCMIYQTVLCVRAGMCVTVRCDEGCGAPSRFSVSRCVKEEVLERLCVGSFQACCNNCGGYDTCRCLIACSSVVPNSCKLFLIRTTASSDEHIGAGNAREDERRYFGN